MKYVLALLYSVTKCSMEMDAFSHDVTDDVLPTRLTPKK